MEKFRKRYFIIIGLLSVASLFTLFVFYCEYNLKHVSLSDNIKNIPLKIDKWDGRDIPIEKATFDILETNDVLMREYVDNNSDVVYLAIVYYSNSKIRLHLPEGCYSGQGSFIVSKGIENIHLVNGKSFDTNRLILKGDKGNQVILYFFKSGDFITSSYYKMRMCMMLNMIRYRKTDGALVRFSIPIKEDNVEESLKTLKDFIEVFVPAMLDTF